jgi:hypothetical protein
MMGCAQRKCSRSTTTSVTCRPWNTSKTDRPGSNAHRIATDLVHPWVIGYHASHFRGLFWKYVDVDPALQAQNLP